MRNKFIYVNYNKTFTAEGVIEGNCGHYMVSEAFLSKKLIERGRSGEYGE